MHLNFVNKLSENLQYLHLRSLRKMVTQPESVFYHFCATVIHQAEAALFAKHRKKEKKERNLAKTSMKEAERN